MKLLIVKIGIYQCQVEVAIQNYVLHLQEIAYRQSLNKQLKTQVS